MPRTLVRAHRDEDRHRSLGWLGLAWMEHFVVHGPGAVQGQPVSHGDEYTGFIVDAYMCGDHPSNNHMLYDSAFLSRPKGCDKSGLGARLALFEGLGPCRFGGWARGGEIYEDPWGLDFRYVYQAGEPMGRHCTAPVIRCLATEENQAATNVFQTIHFNITDDEFEPLLSFVPGVDAGVDKILLPHGGDIRVSTASSSAKDGGRETFLIMDESHLYNTPELRRMYRTVTRNLRKRKLIDGTWYLETTTMFAPGEESMAELTYAEAEALREGRKRRGRHRLLYDHRWGECKDLADEEDLRLALRESYGDALAWMDLDSLVDEFYDLRNEAADSRRYFLNAKTSSSDSWIAEHEWVACKRPGQGLKKRDVVTLGFDGSVRDDATALVACRPSDGHLELIGLWERPEGPEGESWSVDGEAVDAAVANAMRHYRVVGFFADPAHWQDYLDRWHNEFAEKMQVQASAKKPLEWWTNRPTAIVAALQRFYEAVQGVRLGYTPAEDRAGRPAELSLALTRHVLNAKRAETRAGLAIRKDTPKSMHKIDAAMAAVLAYEAAREAVAAGLTTMPDELVVPRRIR
jgi:hypothetical protein